MKEKYTILGTSRGEHKDGNKIALMQRENSITPFIVCGINKEGEPQLQHGFHACMDMEAATHVFPQDCNTFSLHLNL